MYSNLYATTEICGQDNMEKSLYKKKKCFPKHRTITRMIFRSFFVAPAKAPHSPSHVMACRQGLPFSHTQQQHDLKSSLGMMRVWWVESNAKLKFTDISTRCTCEQRARKSRRLIFSISLNLTHFNSIHSSLPLQNSNNERAAKVVQGKKSVYCLIQKFHSCFLLVWPELLQLLLLQQQMRMFIVCGSWNYWYIKTHILAYFYCLLRASAPV